MIPVLIVALAAAALVAAGLFWRHAARRRPLPCPAWLIPLLENPYMEWQAGSRVLLERAAVQPGMWVLDVGAGPGRLALPAAERVGPAGRVVALDLQPAMLRRLERRVAERGLTNLDTILAGAGEGRLPSAAFDRALLVTVLGEIRDKAAALREIHGALKPGGLLSVTEVLPDPHYQSRAAVRRMAEAAGFRVGDAHGTWVAFTLNLVKES